MLGASWLNHSLLLFHFTGAAGACFAQGHSTVGVVAEEGDVSNFHSDLSLMQTTYFAHVFLIFQHKVA